MSPRSPRAGRGAAAALLAGALLALAGCDPDGPPVEVMAEEVGPVPAASRAATWSSPPR